jgi:hypothetical protein
MGEGIENEITIGGAPYDAKDDYLKSITQILYKLTNAGDEGLEHLSWISEYYVNLLVNRIIDPKDRDAMREAKQSLKRIREQEKRSGKNTLTKDEAQKIVIEVNLVILGEMMSYVDKYYGFETRLAVMA